MAVTASQLASPSDWPRTTSPVSAANTGLTLMKTPKKPAGTRRSASRSAIIGTAERSEEHTSELQSHVNLVCRLLLEKKKKKRFKRQTLKKKKKIHKENT